MNKPVDFELQTNEALDRFTSAAKGLFEINGRHTETFEQGLYACAVAKPSKKMRNALGIDREILIVASTFKDQQQRTIKFTAQKIADSNGRLETTVAIVLHRDTEGNAKLKNWGRDKGIAILSIRDGTQTSNAEALEKSLCLELYSHDPFDVTGPVSDDANFYGRRDEAIELARKLQRGQIRSCLGIRKVGKTSIINRVIQEMEKSHDCVTLMVDCSRDDVWSLNASQLLVAITETAQHAIDNSLKYVKLTLPGHAGTPSSLDKARSKLETLFMSAEKPFVLVFDEVDYITPGSPTNKKWVQEFNPFWRNLRSAYQECARQGGTFSMLIAGVSSHWFTIESINDVENAALAFIPEEYVSPMPTGATVAMLKRLGKTSGLHFDEPSVELIAQATGNMPYWSRKCCSYISRFVPVQDRPCEVKIERSKPLVEAFVREEGAAIAEVALTHLFRVHPSLKQATVDLLAELTLSN